MAGGVREKSRLIAQLKNVEARIAGLLCQGLNGMRSGERRSFGRKDDT